MKDYMLEIAISAKSHHPYDWYEQRNEILSFIEILFKDHPNCYKQQWIGDHFNVVTFKFENQVFFWWDCINDNVIECSGFERIIGDVHNKKVRTEILWFSDPDDLEPMIPKLPIRFIE